MASGRVFFLHVGFSQGPQGFKVRQDVSMNTEANKGLFREALGQRLGRRRSWLGSQVLKVDPGVWGPFRGSLEGSRRCRYVCI